MLHRVALIGFVAFATAACESQPLAYQSTLYQDTNGIALRGADASGRSVAQAGMVGTTCEVDTRWASLGSDIDYPSSNETVQDAGTVNGRDVVVVTADEKVYVQEGTDWTVNSEAYDAPGVTEAVVAGTDVIALIDRGNVCAVQWVMSGESKLLESGACSVAYDLTADPSTGSAIVGSDSGAMVITPTTTSVVTEQASSLSEWDATVGVLYTAASGGSVLSAFDLDGTLRWATELGGAIYALDDMGTRGMAAVSVQLASGTGAVILVDGWTGAVVENVGVPQAVTTIKGSPDGRTLALVERNQVHFYGTDTQSSGWGMDDWGLGDTDWDVGWGW